MREPPGTEIHRPEGTEGMPANLPPQYQEAEKRYREAKTPDARIEALEEMLAVMPKHKGTDKLKAELRRRIAKQKDEARTKKGGTRKGTAFSIDRQGAAQVVIAGPPNSGKSSLVAKLTNASPEVADFPGTTQVPTPGMAPWENIQFQLVDTPPLTKEYVDPLMGDLIRRADLLVLLLDLKEDPIQQLEDLLEILRSWRIFPRGHPVPGDLARPPSVKKVLLAMNKVDEEKEEEDFLTFLELTATPLPAVGISVRKERNLKEFMNRIFLLSDLVRVCTKVPGKPPDLDEPFVMPRGGTVATLAEKIHKDVARKLKAARIWGRAVRDGQMVQKDYVFEDGDVVEIHAG